MAILEIAGSPAVWTIEMGFFFSSGGFAMRTATTGVLRSRLSALVASLRRGSVIITRRGKAVALLVHLDDDLLDDFIIGQNRRLLAGMRRGVGRWKSRALKTRPLSAVRARILP